MKRRWLSLTLALSLTWTLALPALAEEENVVVLTPGQSAQIDPATGEVTPAESQTPAEPETTPLSLFLDVPGDAWYADYVNLAAIKGLLQGTGGGYFNPQRSVTLGEVVTLAARIYAQSTGMTVPEADLDQPWYQGAYRFCASLGLFSAADYPMDLTMTDPATRFQVVEFLDPAMPSAVRTQLNWLQNGDVPDLSETDPHGAVVYSWYRMGILEGDDTGAFRGNSFITRMELATILCRITGDTPRIHWDP